MSFSRITLAATIVAVFAGPTFAAHNDAVIVSGKDDPVIVSGVEARVVQPIFAPQDAKWTRKLGPAGGYYPEKAARDMRNVVAGQAALECDLAATGKLTACKVLNETPKDYAFGDAALRMAEKGVLTAVSRGDASERVRMVVPFAPPAKN